MSIVPTWPIAAGVLVVGFALGAGVDHLWMSRKVDRLEKEIVTINAKHAEQERVRQVQRAEDERKAREIEHQLANKARQIESEKQHEISRVKSDADALIARLRQQAASKPARTSTVPGSCPVTAPGPGANISIGGGERVVRLAERADEIRVGLAACYKAYDSLEQPPAQRGQAND